MQAWLRPSIPLPPPSIHHVWWGCLPAWYEAILSMCRTGTRRWAVRSPQSCRMMAAYGRPGQPACGRGRGGRAEPGNQGSMLPDLTLTACRPLAPPSLPLPWWRWGWPAVGVGWCVMDGMDAWSSAHQDAIIPVCTRRVPYYHGRVGFLSPRKVTPFCFPLVCKVGIMHTCLSQRHGKIVVLRWGRWGNWGRQSTTLSFTCA